MASPIDADFLWVVDRAVALQGERRILTTKRLFVVIAMFIVMIYNNAAGAASGDSLV